ncbi:MULTISPECIES: MbtH family protein [Streptomyces]|uniref:MbtH family protein n=1 Tax=Streptomyces cinereoruber TaxID=67260 RepID=A0AAV4KRW6_9ACTN|nr:MULTISPECIES: MbtH family NRPS accessory protein [Streptomyces]AVH97002.1 MbtH family protein [Streptomyces sp. WAC00288]KYG55610.1 hypothetical protein AWI43_15270 [Streptomyces sp. WAC04657]MBB4160107.1 MbtH protein [Streptomyces cinereoruber]MBY8818283.1 MbtH family NRPS accessory protein [Streptomyces cinereoruber]NIH61045.1 MbtH protein [Streptomyces cinereoruber]
MPDPTLGAQDRCVVVVNGEGQYALWPEFAPPPAGWTPVHGPADRASCVAHVDAHWTDMRPLSLVDALD